MQSLALAMIPTSLLRTVGLSVTENEQKEKENKTNKKTWQNKLLRNRPYWWKVILERFEKIKFTLLFTE